MRRYYLSVISGQRRGVIPALLRGVLWLLTIVYAALHRTRQVLYRLGVFRSVKFPCPVISVGNITAGGTGKTPLVEFLARWFVRRNYRTAILARGYGRSSSRDADDEDLISEMELENVVRLAGKDRVASGRKALSEYRADLLILDDGFQHYRIQRGLDIVAIDATQPFANGHLLPRGMLRERPSALRRADLVILTRTDQVTPGELEDLRAKIGPAVETIHKPVHVRSLWNRKKHGLDWLRGRSVYAFCGVGNPEAFRRTLEAVGATVVKFRAYEDHHPYAIQDLRRMNAEAQEFMAEAIVTTEKDATKVNAEGFELPLAALRIEIEVTRHEELLEERLLAVVRDIPRAAAPIGR
ncbi:MAG TPA: tetraacyldisaccharide 4'-kinase [Planctomycetota bacterium]|nr:tetraacyldisaccharide 4'-kinase [Planctomycetota bacterium]